MPVLNKIQVIKAAQKLKKMQASGKVPLPLGRKA